MIIFIYGNDSFRVLEKAQIIKKAFLEKHDPSGMNTSVFPEEGKTKLDPAQILQSICSFPFLGEKRMVIIHDLIATAKKEVQKIWEEGLLRTPESTIVVLVESTEPRLLEKKTLFKKLKEHTEVHFYPFEELKGNELVKWVQARVQLLGGKIERNALQALVECVGSDLWQMHHEIEKLIAFSSGKTIDLQTVHCLVHASFEGQIFSLIDAISRKQTTEALRLLQEERWSGANEFYLMNMLSRQVRILLGVRALLDQHIYVSKELIAKELGIHPFGASKALVQVRGFTLDQLLSVHKLLFQFDHQMKTGQIQADLAVDLIATKLLTAS